MKAKSAEITGGTIRDLIRWAVESVKAQRSRMRTSEKKVKYVNIFKFSGQTPASARPHPASHGSDCHRNRTGVRDR